MLVLSRGRDECIMIGDDVVITVLDIRGDKVRLGIAAPSDVPVHRQEVYEAIRREGRPVQPGSRADRGPATDGPVPAPGMDGRIEISNETCPERFDGRTGST